MRTICAWCGKVLKQGKGETSHGICKKCKAQVLADLANRSSGGSKDGTTNTGSKSRGQG